MVQVQKLKWKLTFFFMINVPWNVEWGRKEEWEHTVSIFSYKTFSSVLGYNGFSCSSLLSIFLFGNINQSRHSKFNHGLTDHEHKHLYKLAVPIQLSLLENITNINRKTSPISKFASYLPLIFLLFYK